MLSVHGLRHTAASLALAAGVHPKVVSERLGHSTVSLTLDTYSHAIPALQESAAELMAQLVIGEARPLAVRLQFGRSDLRCDALPSPSKAPCLRGLLSGPCRNRTYNLEIKSLLLCQLS